MDALGRSGPRPELIEDCVHCGFCLPTCPTYLLWGEEVDSPRGRIVLMRAAHEEGELAASQVQAWDNCLGCMACVTACPSGVRYDELIEATRAQVERRWQRPRSERLARAALFALLEHPQRLRRVAPLTGLARRAAPLLGRWPRLRALARLAPRARAPVDLPLVTRAQGPARGRVALLQGCVQRAFFGEVNAATADVLAVEGWDVLAPQRPDCCGALALHVGRDAREQARATIAALEGCDAIVVNAAGCGSAMKGYDRLLGEDPAWAARAAAFAARVRDVHELLAEHPPRATRHPLRLEVAYHDACHLAHAQGVRAQPRALLQAIPGLVVREPAEQEICCGSAGVYNLLHPEPAAELGARKAASLRATGAAVVAAANPGCAAQLRVHAPELRVVHPIELLRASIRNAAL